MTKLPQKPGWYIWCILDLNYCDIGLVQVVIDDKKHIKYLKDHHKNNNTFYIYENDEGVTLTMYHQAFDHIPPTKNGEPMVDGYAPFDFNSLVIDPIKFIPQRLPERK